MAFNLKYTFSLVGVYTADTYYFKIYEDGFAGSARTFTSGWGPRNAIVVKTDTSETDPMFPIRPKVCELNLFLNCNDDNGQPFTEADLTDILFSEDRTVQFELLQGAALLLTGWFTPQTTTSWNAYKYGSITLTFTDGLASLNGINYQLPTAYNYEIYNFRKIINDCLNQTGLELNIYYSNTLYYGADTDLLLDRIGIETVALRLDNGTQTVSCFEALSLIMRAIGCCLFQKDGIWHIENFTDKSQTDEHYATIIWATQNAALSMSFGTFAKQDLISTSRYATEKSMIVGAFKPKSQVNATGAISGHVHAGINYLFRYFTANVPDSWTKSSAFLVTRQAGSGFIYGVDIQGYANNTVGFVDEYIRTSGYPVKKGARILIDWRFNILATDGIEAPQPRVQIRVNDAANMSGTTVNESLKGDSTWQSGIYWLQTGTTGSFAEEVTVENDGYLFMLIGRPYLSSTGAASQTTYYVSCEFFDVTVLGGMADNIQIETNYKSVQQVVNTGKKYIFVDDQINHLGIDQVEMPAPGSPLSDYYISVLKNPLTRDNLASNIRSDETLAGSGTLLLQIARLRGMLYSSNFISIDVTLYGQMVDIFGIYEIDILGEVRRMVCIAVETNVKTETQNATFIQSTLALEAGLSNSINYLT
jgi:hypothetical protein